MSVIVVDVVKIKYSEQKFQKNRTSWTQDGSFMYYTMLNLNNIYYMNINMNKNKAIHIQAAKPNHGLYMDLSKVKTGSNQTRHSIVCG